MKDDKVIIMNILCETIVCRAKENTDARLERMIKARIEFSKRSDFALNSWYGRSQSDELLFMIQTTFKLRILSQTKIINTRKA